MASGHSEGRKSNRLAQEQSAYLLQHAENPVDWYPWGEEAFAVARQRDCPIFLSIGYSSCHWCHVMEHESFESEEIAEVLNKSFVAIKVDKEQRPDVDKTYMTYIQATQGGGGWPMSVFLTPELHPFFGGTYFPPQDAYGRPGFKTVLNRLALIWNQKKEEIKASSADSMRQLGEIISSRASGSGDAGDTVEELAKSISYCANSFEHRFDSRLGGFGSAPKFPRPSELLVLMTEYARLLSINKEDDARRMLHMATFTMKQMASGGMRDQLGGGFHRYSVDEYWHVPHFEIMLYDNPQLVQSNLAAFQITRDLSHASTARGVLDYLLRDMKHPEGGFCAAEDADSLDTSDGKKKEGQFYVWSEAEILEVLGSGGGGGGGKLSSSELASMFASHYGIKPEGNCTRSPRSDPHHEFQGKNVLYQAKTLEETSRAGNLSIGEADELLSFCREKLFNARKTRPRPFRDDKILTAWNGMAICALATAGRVLSSEDPPLEKLFPVEGRNPLEYIQAAKTAAECIRKFLHDRTTGHLRRAYMNGPSNVPGFSDDYAWCIAGNLELYFATGEVEYVQWAMELQEKMDELFWDAAGGGYYQSPSPASITTESGEETTGRGESTSAGVLLRMKEDYDGAEPAASSIAVSNLWKLAALSGTQKAAELKRQAGKCAAGFSGQLKEAPSALPQMCAALHLLELGHARQVIIAGKKGEADTEALINAAYSVHAPDMVVIHLDLSNEPAMNFWKEQNPEAVSIAEATGMTVNEPATAFICQNFTCKKPTTDPEVVKKTLAEPSTKGSPSELAPIVSTGRAATSPLMTKKKAPPQLPKVSLLFLTRGPMPLESIWRDFLGVDSEYTPSKNGTTSAAWQKYFSIYVHTSPGFKYPSESIFAPFAIKYPITAKWGDYTIVDAERKLIEAALEDPLNSYFILLSETHIPLYSAAVTYLQFATAQRSRIHACNNPSDDQDWIRRMTYRMTDEMNLTHSGITGDTWKKSSQWFGLIRSHAQIVARESEIYAAFKEHCNVIPNKTREGEYVRFCVSDEHYIPTMLAIKGREEECECDGHVTRVVWTGNYMHPKSFGKSEATTDTLRHELRGEEECQEGRELERIAGQVLRKVDELLEDVGEAIDDGNEENKEKAEEEKEVDISELNGAELISYAMINEDAAVMVASCPLFARKILKEAEVEWRELLKPSLKPTQL